MKQTATEWLKTQVGNFPTSENLMTNIDKLLLEAIAMNEDDIKNAYSDGVNARNSDLYYKSIYGERGVLDRSNYLTNYTRDLMTKIKILTACLMEKGVGAGNIICDDIYITDKTKLFASKFRTGLISISEDDYGYNNAVTFDFIKEINISDIVTKMDNFINNGINYKIILSIHHDLYFNDTLDKFGNFYMSIITNEINEWTDK